MAIGLVVALGGRRVAERRPGRRVGAEHAVEQRAQVRALHLRDQVAQRLLHVPDRARRAVEQVGQVVLVRLGRSQRADGQLRPVARVQRVAARDRDGRARLAHRDELGNVLAHERDDRAGAVAQRQPQVLAVAVRAQLALAHEQDLLDVLAVDELANEHGAQS